MAGHSTKSGEVRSRQFFALWSASASRSMCGDRAEREIEVNVEPYDCNTRQETNMFSRRNFIKTGTAALAAGVATSAAGQNIESLPPVVTSGPSGGSIASTNVNISIADSPLKQALDIYYDNFINLAQGFGDKDRMLINNTITSFDISQDTPYFNEGLFRAFADRVFKDSPENLGSNRAD